MTAVLAAAHAGVSTAQDISIGHVLLQMVVALGIVLGGIWGFGKVMGRSSRGRRAGARGRGRPNDGLRVLSRQQIAKGKSIAVVQAGDQCFLVGVADSGLTPLGELRRAAGGTDAEAEVAEPTLPATGRAGPGAPITATTAPDVPAGSAGVGVRLAPVDLDGIDLSALVRSEGAGGTDLDGPGRHPTTAIPTMRTWLDSLREATVRR